MNSSLCAIGTSFCFVRSVSIASPWWLLLSWPEFSRCYCCRRSMYQAIPFQFGWCNGIPRVRCSCSRLMGSMVNGRKFSTDTWSNRIRPFMLCKISIIKMFDDFCLFWFFLIPVLSLLFSVNVRKFGYKTCTSIINWTRVSSTMFFVVLRFEDIILFRYHDWIMLGFHLQNCASVYFSFRFRAAPLRTDVT